MLEYKCICQRGINIHPQCKAKDHSFDEPPSSTCSESLPRRSNMERWTSAEKAIYDAMQEVENLEADPVLTNVVVTLSEAMNTLADYIDAPTKAVTRLEDRGDTSYLIVHVFGCEFPTALPVIASNNRYPPSGRSEYTWNGKLDKPTLHQSVQIIEGNQVTHVILTDGLCRYLADTTKKELVRKTMPLQPLTQNV